MKLKIAQCRPSRKLSKAQVYATNFNKGRLTQYIEMKSEDILHILILSTKSNASEKLMVKVSEKFISDSNQRMHLTSYGELELEAFACDVKCVRTIPN